jgi:hypothetical protein
MDNFAHGMEKSPTLPCVHPLLLSLAGEYDESEESEYNPNISSIDENDLRALRSNFYTPAESLPTLDIHFCAENGVTQ